jgi:hypothetical protein
VLQITALRPLIVQQREADVKFPCVQGTATVPALAFVHDLLVRYLNEDHLFEWDRATVLARETKWKTRKFHEAATAVEMLLLQIISTCQTFYISLYNCNKLVYICMNFEIFVNWGQQFILISARKNEKNAASGAVYIGALLFGSYI